MTSSSVNENRSGGGYRWQPDAEASARVSPGLYLVSTPIGNLDDITLRALDVLAAADIVACEDTRITAKLLSRYGIRATTTPYHDQNAASARPALLEHLRNGAAVALVSDAGTPLVSDPGFKLVRSAIEAGYAVVPVPGASSLLAALVASGLPTDRFLFAGFLPPKSAARRSSLAELATVPATLVFLESPRRLAAVLADMAAVFGPRPAAVARELTKLFEETRRDTLSALASHYTQAGAPKGEVVVVVGPPERSGGATDAEVDAALAEALPSLRLRDAVDQVAAGTGRPRREVYARALRLRGE